MGIGSGMTEPYGRQGLPLEQARARILGQLQPLGLQELLPLAVCLGRTTAEPVLAAAAVPGFRASIMDGYAIAGSAQPEPGARWQLVGTSAAAAPHGASLAAGEAVRILTGAVVPDGSERVLPQELVGREADQLELLQPCGANAWIRQPEEEAAVGEELVGAGQRLGVAELGRLASCGVQQLQVTRRPRIGLLISGDELLPPGQERGPGQIWESNSALLSALLQRLGFGVAEQRVVVDQPEPLREAL
ncbi:MAG: molybdopterin-binding protein, partial [Cyanobium sp.]